MLKKYFLLGFRTLAKRKLYSFINIAGLSLALGCSLVCFAFVSFFYGADQFHTKVDRLFTIQTVANHQGKEEVNGKSPLPLGQALEDLSQVEGIVRVNRKSGLITVGDETFEDTFTFADADFFKFFTFPLQSGDVNEWGKPSSLVLDQASAKKYFGNSSALGQAVILRFTDTNGKEVTESFTVTGVAAEFPKNASFRFRMLLPFEFQTRLGMQVDDWRKPCDATFVLVKSPEDIQPVITQAQSYISTYNSFNPDLPLERFHFESLKTASLNSYKVSGDVFSGAPKLVFMVLFVISFFLVVMACFNYMNIAIAQSTYRLKEIGVRKVMGSNRLQLIAQFLAENLVLCVLALVVGVLLAQTVLLPGFSNLFGLSFEINFANPILWITLVGLLAISAIGGAGYPALYISKFQPGQVLKDKARITGKNLFRRSLLSFQFFLSYFSITTAIAFILNADFQRSKSWGYNPDNKIIVHIDQPDHFVALRNELERFPSVTSVSGSVESLGKSTDQELIKVGEEHYSVNSLHVGDRYISSMGLELVKGRSFNEQLESDFRESVLINEAFAAKFNWDNPIGQQFEIDSVKYHVIGEVKDFHYEPFTERIEPLLFTLVSESNYNYLVATTTPGSADDVNSTIQSSWKKIAPERPLVSYYQNTVFDNAFREFDTATNVMTSTAFITIFIAIIGLFGLTSLTLARKLKELSIRKVLGGSTSELGWVLNKEIVWLMGIACAAGIPLSYFFLKSFLLTVSRYVLPLGPSLFIGTLTILAVLAATTVSIHVYRIATMSPVKNLREE